MSFDRETVEQKMNALKDKYSLTDSYSQYGKKTGAQAVYQIYEQILKEDDFSEKGLAVFDALGKFESLLESDEAMDKPFETINYKGIYEFDQLSQKYKKLTFDQLELRVGYAISKNENVVTKGNEDFSFDELHDFYAECQKRTNDNFSTYFRQSKSNREIINFSDRYGIASVRETMNAFCGVLFAGMGVDYEKIYRKQIDSDTATLVMDKMCDVCDSNDEKAIKWIDETFTKGFARLLNDTDKMAEPEKIGDLKFRYDPMNRYLVSIMAVSATSISSEKPEFVNRINEAGQKLNLRYKDKEFDYKQNFLENSIKTYIFNTNMENNGIGASRVNLDLEVASREFLMHTALVNTELSDSDFYISQLMSTMQYKVPKRLQTWLEDNKEYNKDNALDYLEESIQNGSFPGNVHVDCETKQITTDVDMDKFVSNFYEWEKKNSKELFSKRLTKSMERDFNNSYLKEDELDSILNDDKERNIHEEKITAYVKEKCATISSKSEEFLKKVEKNEQPVTKEDLSTVQNTLGVLKKISANKSVEDKYLNAAKLEKKGYGFPLTDEKTNGELKVSDENQNENNSYKKTIIKPLKEVIKKANDVSNSFDSEVSNKLSGGEFLQEVRDYCAVMDKNTTQRLRQSPLVKNSIECIKSEFSSYLDRFANTSKKDKETNELVGNSDYFKEMYEAIGKVCQYNGEKISSRGEGMDELLQNAVQKIGKYVQERDSFFKFTSKGRTRLNLAKELLDKASFAEDFMSEKSEELRVNHHEANKRAQKEIVSIEEKREAGIGSEQKSRAKENIKSEEKIKPNILGK